MFLIKNEHVAQDLEFEHRIKELSSEIDRIAPNLRAASKYIVYNVSLSEAEKKLRETADEFDASRQEAKQAKDAFQAIKDERYYYINFSYALFHKAYTHIAENIDKIYKQLTKTRTFPLGGTAYLSLEDSDVNQF